MRSHSFAPTKALSLCALALLTMSSPVQAQVTNNFVVDSHTMPWLNSANPTKTFGANDGTAPLVITGANGYSFAAGGTFTFTYLSGYTAPGASFPDGDGVGDTTYPANNSGGSSGLGFPSIYLDSAQYPVYLMALIGTFTDSADKIVGTPFATGNGPFNVTAPAGASQLQLGFNDDIFSDNVGSLTIRVSGPPAPRAVPEPGSVALLVGMGISGASFLARRRKQARDIA